MDFFKCLHHTPVSSLTLSSIQGDGFAIETVMPNGLVMGHAYSITCVKEVAQ